jgi:zinc and cadmium transporter
MTTFGYLAVYGVAVVGASLAGGWLPSLVRLTHQRMQMMISLVAGVMLGVGLFHMLPHAAMHLGSLDRAVFWTMVGLLTMFVLMRWFHPHHHGDVDDEECEHEHDHDHDHDHHEHGHAHCDHDHDHEHYPDERGFSWLGIAAGMSLHTLIDGVALAAAVEAESLAADAQGLPGVGTFLAIALHKPLDALSITALMASQGWPKRSQMIVNLAYSLVCPIGALLFAVGVRGLQADSSVLVGAALAFSSGVFLCIALADLLPEVEYHSHDRFKLSAALLAGVALAYAIGFIEPHGHHPGHEGHDHAGRDAHEHHSHDAHGH